MARARPRSIESQLVQQAPVLLSSAPAVASTLAITAAPTVLAGSPVLTAAVPLIAALPIALGAYLYYNRPRFPKVNVDDLARAISAKRLLERQGHQPVITTDPYTGNIGIGTQGQPLDLLFREAATRLAAASGLPERTAEIRALRDEYIDLRAAAGGPFPDVASLPKIPKGVVCGVMRPTADAPLQYVCRRA